MEHIKTLLARYSQTAFLFLMGLILIIYLALGILYLQQAPQQQSLKDQTTKVSAIVRNPMPSIDPLQTAYDNANLALTPISDNVTIAMLVRIAEESGINIGQESGSLLVPIPAHGSSGPYQLVSFRNIHVQGERSKVEAFISIFDSDQLLKTTESSSPRIVVRVVTRVVTNDVQVSATGQEGERRAEFREVIDAVTAMMEDNNLSVTGIPGPMSFNLGRATNRMGDDPGTTVFEGFPDITTTVVGKGYTGNTTPRQGYLLYQHDKISSDNTTLYTTLNYIPYLSTTYYYTAETDGTIRQWGGPNVAIATEYPDSSQTKTELRASVDIDFYFKPVTASK